jgi:hypothetical protein
VTFFLLRVVALIVISNNSQVQFDALDFGTINR